MLVSALAPVYSAMWLKMDNRQPSSPAKFSIGLLFLGLGTLLMVPAAVMAGSGRVSPWWLVVVYFLQVVGEMCLSPVGLSTVTRLAPAKLEAGPCLARDLPCHQPCLHTAHRGTRPYQKVRRAISYLPATRANVVAPTLPLDSAVAGSGFAVRRHTVGVVFQLAH